MTEHDARRARRPLWAACVLLGVVLLTLGIVLAVDRDAPADTRHAVPVVDVGAVPGGTPTTTGRSGGAVEHHASRHTRRATKHVVPTGSSLLVARFGIRAPITHVRVVGGVMQVPLDPHTVGWWTSGAAPGDAHGTTVIVGHINYAGVSGALSVLPQLRPGDTVTIAEPTGARSRFTIAAVRTYAKTTGIPQSVFATGGRARLALITCGGPFDPATGNYEDNIVAYAVPAHAP